MKLISMTDFVIQTGDNLSSEDRYDVLKVLSRQYEYANFLKQPLALWMFVPVSSSGEILKGRPLSPAPDSEWIRWENEEFEFYKAKERVLFEEVTIETHIVNGDVNLTSIIIQEKTVFTHDTYIHTGEVFKEHENKIVENLPTGIKLTQTAINQIMS